MRDTVFVYFVVTWLTVLLLLMALAFVWLADLHSRLRRLEQHVRMLDNWSVHSPERKS